MLKLRGNEQVLNDDTDKKETVFTKSVRMAAKKDKYKKIRSKKNLNLAEKIQEVAPKKVPKLQLKKSATNTKK